MVNWVAFGGLLVTVSVLELLKIDVAGDGSIGRVEVRVAVVVISFVGASVGLTAVVVVNGGMVVGSRAKGVVDTKDASVDDVANFVACVPVALMTALVCGVGDGCVGMGEAVGVEVADSVLVGEGSLVGATFCGSVLEVFPLESS